MTKQKLSIVFIVVFLSLFYLILGIGYSQSYNPGFFPDEFAHMGYVVDVMKNHFPDYNNGLIYSSNKLNYLNHPALYYIIVGELASLLHLQDAFASVGRYVNMVISLIIIVMTCRMLYQTTQSRLATFVGGSFLLVIPMFVVLGSAVSNDQINVLGCTFVIYGLLGLMEIYKDNKPLTSSILFICAGGVIASLSKATGSLVIVCLLASVVIFNFSRFIGVIKGVSLKQWLIITIFITIVIIYFVWMHTTYGRFYPAPQGTPALWFFIEQPYAKRLIFSEFLGSFLTKNLITMTIPYGHVFILDNEARIFSVKSILILLAAMAGYVLVNNKSKRNPFFNMAFSFIIAFFIFLVMYFFTIRDMHLKTGYTGAMQARYFFGFLPAFSLVIAQVFFYINRKIIKGLVMVVMIFGLFTSIYPAIVKLLHLRVWRSTAVIEQPLFNTSYGYLTKGRSFEQTILAESDSLKGVELTLATFARKNHGRLTLELVDNSGAAIVTKTVMMENITDNAYAWFDFNGVKIVKNQEYTLRLKCDDCTQDNAITWRAIEQQLEAPIFLLTKFGPDAGNKYSKGEAYVDGVNVGGAYSFRLYF
ncbi:hypothetical protein [Leclercia adecarboxylata]|uniref:hypothetical protein n=1 Tax=Leclercia adecarboxylata TaxID=83655 RepID=UPI003850BACD